jgi:hypothetical protein
MIEYSNYFYRDARSLEPIASGEGDILVLLSLQ